MRKMNGRQQNFKLRRVGGAAYNRAYTVLSPPLIKRMR
jgi:hypothetical protein